MPRKRDRKSTKGLHAAEAMESALKDVLAGKSVRAAAKLRGINYNTLNRYHKKLRGATEIPPGMSLTSNYKHNLVFPPACEEELAAYVKERSELGYGLDSEQVKKLAYDLAIANNVKVPETWIKNQIAGQEWFRGFMQRQEHLSLRTPEQCSVARASAFNKVNIQSYFEKLRIVLQRNPKFESGERIFNADEVGTTTVGAVSRKIVAPKGVKQVHQVKGQERGESVTSLFFICANGTFLPPVMLFPRKNFNNGMLKDCYPNTLGLASGKKGYMNHEMMVPAIKHFIKHSDSSKENQSLLIVDNFGSHITLEVIRLCKENGVTLFTLPPHTTHRTQPLDVGVFGPFKKGYDRAVHVWTGNNPAVSASIYEVAGFVNTAASQAMTPQNICSAFSATGIFPFNPNIFPERDYIMSSVTYQAAPNNDQEITDNVQEAAELEDTPGIVPGRPALTSRTSDTPAPSTSDGEAPLLIHVSPSDILPIPKAKPKVSTRKPRKKGKCMIATDTPEKNQIEREEAEKKKKAEDKVKRAAIREEKKKEAVKRKSTSTFSKTASKRKKNASRALVFDEGSSSSDENISVKARLR